MMRHRKIRKFRHRSNNRSYFSRDNGVEQSRVGVRQFSNGRGRNNFKQHQSPDKLAEKYNMLAKEALASGDKILSENYFQHADHFMRIVSIKNQNQVKDPINSISEETKTKDLTSNEITKISKTRRYKYVIISKTSLWRLRCLRLSGLQGRNFA